MAQWLRCVEPCSFLPALTLAAWRISINVTSASSVESHSHLFVFHLVFHLCISMLSARSCAKNGRLLIKFGPFHNPQKEKCLHYSAMCVKYKDASHSQTGPFRCAPPLSPTLRLMVKGFGEKSTNRSVPWELRTRQEAGQTPLRWTWTDCEILTLENPPFIKSAVGNIVLGPAPCALKALNSIKQSITTSQSSLITGHSAVSQADTRKPKNVKREPE